MNKRLEKIIIEGLNQNAIEKVGVDAGIQPFTFTVYDKRKLAGVIHGHQIWGTLHIRWLLVLPSYRGKGVGSLLMEKAEAYAREEKCLTIFVETMSFEASGFYEKMGFNLEFSRKGFKHGVIKHYFRKDLHS